MADVAESVLAEAIIMVPAEQIIRSEVAVTDFETSRHRMLCSDTTSQYTNRINLWLRAGTDATAIIDAARERFVAEGWTRDELGEGGVDQGADGSHIETLGSPDDYGLTFSRGEDTDGTTIVQVRVYSPCIPSPADESVTWGLRDL